MLPLLFINNFVGKTTKALITLQCPHVVGGVLEKTRSLCSFLMALLVSCANWLTALFNRISRNYRLVAAKMKDDHIRVKQEIQVTVAVKWV